MPEFAAFTAMFGFKATLWGFAILFSIGTLGFLAVWFMLEAQLQEKEESLLTKESAISQLQENFTAKVQELEHRLTEEEEQMFLPRNKWREL